MCLRHGGGVLAAYWTRGSHGSIGLMKYRRDIDGLRALAVIPVVLFHAGFDGFQGGFVGVDVFFVISGFLITGIILREIEQGNFSIISFYERRARRIAPALIVVIAVTTSLAYLWLLPSDLIEYARSLIFVSLFTSNVLFMYESGYFAGAAELKPLLHTWSLAVEEQFYLIFPPFVLLALRFGRRFLIGSLALLALASLVAAQYGSTAYPTANYYLLFTRWWELAIGSFIAIYLSVRPKPTSSMLSLVGLLAVATSIALFSEDTPFPSALALLPTVGTGLILLYAGPGTVVHRWLSLRPFVWVGLISYSAYLWHQPLFALARHALLDEPSAWTLIGLALLSFALAAWSYRFVERPFRDRRFFSRRQIFVATGSATILAASVGLAGVRLDGLPNRFAVPEHVRASMRWASSECFNQEGAHARPSWLCPIGSERTGEHPDFLLFGDSHSLALVDAFSVAAASAGLSGAYVGASGCTPFLGIVALRDDQATVDCAALNLRVHRAAVEMGIERVVLVARWAHYTDGGYKGDDFSYIGLSPTDEKDESVSRQAFLLGLDHTVRAYGEAGIQVAVLEQAPEQLMSPERAFARAYGVEGAAAVDRYLEDLSATRDQHVELQSFANASFREDADRGELTFMEIADLYCGESRCPIGGSSVSYYFDDDHLSIDGASRLEERIQDMLSAGGTAQADIQQAR